MSAAEVTITVTNDSDRIIVLQSPTGAGVRLSPGQRVQLPNGSEWSIR